MKVWARSIFLLAIFTSTALLIIPKSMQKQARFVAEMLVLLCVVAPLAGLVNAGTREAMTPTAPSLPSPEVSALGKFYADETARRVAEIGQRTGMPIVEVTATTSGAGLSLAGVIVRVSEQPDDERFRAFAESLAAYLGISKDRLRVVVVK